MERGEFEFKGRARQLVSFSGLRYKNITPTDIDMSIDYNRGGVFVFGEFKFGDAPIKKGQRDHLRFLTDSLTKSGKQAIALIARHDQPKETDVVAKECVVDEYRYEYKWNKPIEELTIKQFIERFLKHIEGKQTVKVEDDFYDDIEYYEERAGILEFEAGYSRDEAESLALKMMVERRLQIDAERQRQTQS